MPQLDEQHVPGRPVPLRPEDDVRLARERRPAACDGLAASCGAWVDTDMVTTPHGIGPSCPSNRSSRQRRLSAREPRTGDDVARARPGQVDAEGVAHAAGPRRQHHDLVGQEDRLVDVVGDEEDGEVEVLPQRQQPLLHAQARLRVERGEGLVEQDHVLVAEQRPQQRRALPHAARERRRIVVLEGARGRSAAGRGRRDAARLFFGMPWISRP